MALSRADWGALASAGAVALAMPAILLWPPREAGAGPPASPAKPLTVPTTPRLSAVFTRPLFEADQPDEAPPPDAPQLIGIAGRIGKDAVALVRDADGKSRSLEVGAAVDGWTLQSLAIDAAYFTRGGQRLRVALPAGQ